MSRAQVDQVTMQTRSMLPPPRQAAQLLSRETSRSAPLRLDCPFPSTYVLVLTALHSITVAERLLASPDDSVPQSFFCQRKDRAPIACDIVSTIMQQLASCMSRWVPCLLTSEATSQGSKDPAPGLRRWRGSAQAPEQAQWPAGAASAAAGAQHQRLRAHHQSPDPAGIQAARCRWPHGRTAYARSGVVALLMACPLPELCRPCSCSASS